MRTHIIAKTLALSALALAGLPAAAHSGVEPATTETAAMQRDELRMIGRLRARGERMQGKADYRERKTSKGYQIRFKVELERAERNTRYDIFLDDKLIGSLKTNSIGRGQKMFRTLSDDPDHDPNVPQVNEGSVVTVGAASGSMRVKK